MKLNIKKVVLVGALLLSVLGMAVWQSDCDKPEEQLTEASKPSVEQWKQTAAGPIPLDSIGRSRDTDESERSDRLTGGRIELAQLITGDRRIW
ncbi:MAG: hypothetical protein J2P41_13375, partial [Blastocatellia bacterium]|nr:hypothetical protein [Blastocatellia bacterium]